MGLMDDAVKGGVPSATDLWDAERLLWQAFGCGAAVDLRAVSSTLDTPGNVADRDARRRVRAEVVAALLLGVAPPVAGCVPGVSVTGALIVGDLDISRGVVEYAAVLRDCQFDGSLRLAETTMRTLDLSGSEFAILDASAAAVDGHLLVERCRAQAIMLHDARISRRLSLNGTRLVSVLGVALLADRISVDGGIFCRNGFHAEGDIRLIDADLKGSLDLASAHLVNVQGNALRGDRLKVAGSISFGNSFRANGKIALTGAHVGGQVVFDGAHLATGIELSGLSR